MIQTDQGIYILFEPWEFNLVCKLIMTKVQQFATKVERNLRAGITTQHHKSAI